MKDIHSIIHSQASDAIAITQLDSDNNASLQESTRYHGTNLAYGETKKAFRDYLKNQQDNADFHQVLSGDVRHHLYDETTPLNLGMARKAFKQHFAPTNAEEQETTYLDQITQPTTLKKVPVHYANLSRNLPVKSHGFIITGDPGLADKSGAKIFNFGGDPMRIQVDVHHKLIKKAIKNKLPPQAITALKQLKGSSFKTVESFHQAYSNVRKTAGDCSPETIDQEVSTIRRNCSVKKMEYWIQSESGLFSAQGVRPKDLSLMLAKKSNIDPNIKQALQAMSDNHQTYSNEEDFHQDYAAKRRELTEVPVSAQQIGKELSMLYRLTKCNDPEKDIRAFEANSTHITLKEIKDVSNIELIEKRNQVLLHQRYVDEKLGRSGVGTSSRDHQETPRNEATDTNQIFKYVPRFRYLPIDRTQANCNAGAATFVNAILAEKRAPMVKAASTFGYGVGHKTLLWEPVPKLSLDHTSMEVLSSRSGICLHHKFDLILSAKRNIHLHLYLFKNDVSARFIFELLKIKKQHNPELDIAVTFDDLNIKKDKTYAALLKELKAAHIVVRSRLKGAKSALNINSRKHDKLLIVDAETAIVGSAHISNHCNGYTPSGEPALTKDPLPEAIRDLPWVEQNVRVSGEIAAQIQRTFREKFLNQSHFENQPSVSTRNIPELDRNKVLDQIIDVVKHRPELHGTLALANKIKAQFSQPAEVNETRLQPEQAEFISFDPKVAGKNPITEKVLSMIAEARENITIVTPYYYPPDKINKALVAAIKSNAGLSVTILTNSRKTTDHKTSATLSQHAAKSLMEKVSPEQAQRIDFREWQIASDSGYYQGTVHSKFMMVDNRQCLIGSYNFHPRSHHTNAESALYTNNIEQATLLTSIFNQEYFPGSEHVMPEKTALSKILMKLGVHHIM